MSQVITITSKSVAEQLDKWEVQNYDPLALSSEGFCITLATPVNYVREDSSRLTMVASESILNREWNSAEEDEAWAHL